ncbi:hypothetical protein Pd630_LPD01713 [Rhodococcus opacus PD630]|nr:hypothetical protein Pd630_LPD01713 [Rhodococcus opacus PD630]
MTSGDTAQAAPGNDEGDLGALPRSPSHRTTWRPALYV